MNPPTSWVIVLAIAGVVAGLAGTAIFAGLETGIYVLNRVRLELRVAQGDRAAIRLVKALMRAPEMLSALLATTDVASYLATVSVLALLKIGQAPHADLYAALIAGPLLFTLGQVLPKNIFRVAGETLVYSLSGVMAAAIWLSRILGISPLMMLVSRAILWLPPGFKTEAGLPDPRQRIASILAEGSAHGVLTPVQSHIANRVVTLRSTRVREVMVELAKVASIPIGASREHFMHALTHLHHSRLPVWRDRPGNIVGILNIYDLLFDENQSCARRST